MSDSVQVAVRPETAVRSGSTMGDIMKGIFAGDIAEHVGVSGRVAQAVCGYVPVVGTLCALRDLFADLAKKDSFGAFLNFLALIPFLGGFPKTAHAIHRIRQFGEAAKFTSNVVHAVQDPATIQS